MPDMVMTGADDDDDNEEEDRPLREERGEWEEAWHASHGGSVRAEVALSFSGTFGIEGYWLSVGENRPSGKLRLGRRIGRRYGVWSASVWKGARRGRRDEEERGVGERPAGRGKRRAKERKVERRKRDPFAPKKGQGAVRRLIPPFFHMTTQPEQHPPLRFPCGPSAVPKPSIPPGPPTAPPPGRPRDCCLL